MTARRVAILAIAVAIGALIVALLSTPEPLSEPRCETTTQARERLNVDADFVGPIPVECTK